MKRNAMRKSLFRSIKTSLGRYLAIVGIIALGAAMFVGLKTTKTDMIATGQAFMDGQNMFDLQLYSSLGWDISDVEQIAAIEGVEAAEGVVALDALVTIDASTNEQVYKIYSLPEQVSVPYLLGGRMPQAPNECLADGFHADDSILGSSIRISEANSEQVLDTLKQDTFTVVGYVSTPIYMDMSRGTTSLGNGTVSSYIYVPSSAISVDYYTQIDITLPGDYAVYTEVYDAAVAEKSEEIRVYLEEIAQERADRLYAEAYEEYADGLAEYEKGLAEFEEGKAEALQELADAKIELEKGQIEIDDGRALLEETMAQLDAGERTLDEKRRQLQQANAELEAQLTAAAEQHEQNKTAAKDALAQTESGLRQVNAAISQLEQAIGQLQSGISQLDAAIAGVEAELAAIALQLEQAEGELDRAEQDGSDASVLDALRQRLAQLNAARDAGVASYTQLQAERQQYAQQLQPLQTQKAELVQQRDMLLSTQTMLTDSLRQIEEGFAQLQLEEIRAKAELDAAQVQLNSAELELKYGREEAAKGLKELEEAETALAQGLADYQEGYETAMEEFSNAQAELDSAGQQLEEAKSTIDALKDPQIFTLDRNTNVGYISLDSNSDIVAGVAAVFPVFFLLIAALVCITTMTRMVEEERTQIGILKALGHTKGAIVSKYLFYAGSAAVIGCGLGVVAGSVVFPLILWRAYSIMMLLLPDLVLRINWLLCIGVVLMYTVVTLAVTWYTCHRSMQEVPAELIRPKPPTGGKKLLLEWLPFWNGIGFLNKVMLRNVFRYKQRLLMMLVGIGGCTALLLTGFGFRDSIMDIVDHQFQEITLYDLEVRFSDGLTDEEQEAFASVVGAYSQAHLMYHQSSIEIGTENQVREVSLVVSDERLENFIDFHADGQQLHYPQKGEAMVSIGVAENLGIWVGDTVTLRTDDAQPITVTVSDICENYIYNYVFVTPETVTPYWEETLEKQVACVMLAEDADVHAVAAKLSDQENVLNVSVNQDMADRVGSMLQALDLVVLTIVVCAGLLAVIVLYNLTNINITERIREIATIKVLGFRSHESAAYVFKENLLLTVMGAILGLPTGILLLNFVMDQIRIDMIWMPARLTFPSYVFAVLLTLLSALIVDFALYFKLERVNMAEALKSVE